jgi:hypothetical protein
MSLKADKAAELVQKIKDAKHKLAMTSSPYLHKSAHEAALEELRDAEDAYQEYLYSQRP